MKTFSGEQIEVIREALKEALHLAVWTLAFHGRDRGTDRQEKMLDDLEGQARKVDPLVRSAFSSLDAEPVQPSSGAESAESLIEYIKAYAEGWPRKSVTDRQQRTYILETIAKLEALFSTPKAEPQKPKVPLSMLERAYAAGMAAITNPRSIAIYEHKDNAAMAGYDVEDV